LVTDPFTMQEENRLRTESLTEFPWDPMVPREEAAMQGEGRKRVLIVDNNEDILWTLQATIENAGFDTRTTWSGFEALALLESREFDVLLVDDYLPDLHANDFLKRVRRLTVQPSIVVMQGPTPSATDLRHYASLGASAVVRKRDTAEVCKAISSCCNEQQLVKANVPSA
jgi:CheY-like chemotaxis protein